MLLLDLKALPKTVLTVFIWQTLFSLAVFIWQTLFLLANSEIQYSAHVWSGDLSTFPATPPLHLSQSCQDDYGLLNPYWSHFSFTNFSHDHSLAELLVLLHKLVCIWNLFVMRFRIRELQWSCLSCFTDLFAFYF